MGGGVGIWVNCTLACFFIFIFGSFNASTACPEKRGFFSSVHRKRVSVVGVFLWGRFAQGVKSSLFAPKNHFSVGPIRLSFCMGVNRKHLLSHTRTVVRECCKSDDASQWGNRKFDPLPRLKLLTDHHQNMRA